MLSLKEQFTQVYYKCTPVFWPHINPLPVLVAVNYTGAISTGILSLYLPTALIGYVKIGDAVEDNILLSVDMTDIIIVAISMEIINLLFTYLISASTVFQSMEEVFKVPNSECRNDCMYVLVEASKEVRMLEWA